METSPVNVNVSSPLTDHVILQPSAEPVKPGWKTTEFYLSAFAMLLGLAYTSGIIATGSQWDHIAGVAVTLLAGLGYTVTRGKVKAAMATLLVGCLIGNGATMLAACGTVKADVKAEEAKILDCTKADAGPIAMAFGSLAVEVAVQVATTGKPDVPALEASSKTIAAAQGGSIAACSFGPILASIIKLFPPSTGAAAGPTGATVAADAGEALARLKAAQGVTTIKTSAGVQ